MTERNSEMRTLNILRLYYKQKGNTDPYWDMLRFFYPNGNWANGVVDKIKPNMLILEGIRIIQEQDPSFLADALIVFGQAGLGFRERKKKS